MEKRLIMDVGVHTGEDTEFYLRKDFRVVGIEADPDLYQQLGDRLRDWIVRGDLTLLNVAVAPEDGPVTFYRNLEKSDWGTTSSDWVDRSDRLRTHSLQITVEGRRFDSVLADFGIPYYLKVDIEGADLLCIRALRAAATKPKYVSLESSQTSWKALLEEFSVLEALGYKKVSQQHVPSQVCPNPAREGEYVAHSFAYGSSGAFGEEAPGEWMTQRDAISLYRRIFWTYRVFGNDGFFTKMNWQRPLMWRLRRYLPATLPVPDWYDTHAAL
jgi:FkbM family methyltransferase